eukprot:m.116807 g.116807  ORF g.116807 m.116807 type:complete len:272 (-) comp12863_c0_seq1:104-919(-)
MENLAVSNFPSKMEDFNPLSISRFPLLWYGFSHTSQRSFGHVYFFLFPVCILRSRSIHALFLFTQSLVHACKTKKLLPGTLTHCVRSRDGDVLATMTAQEERAYLQPVIQSTSTYEIPLQQDDENAIYAEVQDPALDEEQQHPSQIYDNVEYEDASDSILKQREPLPKIPTSVTSSTSPLQTSNIHRSESVSSHFNTPMNEWDDHQLAMWLDTRNMSFAKRVFLENGVDGSVFLTLEQDDLSDLGMSKIRCKSLLVKRDKFIQEQEKAMKL